MALTGMRNVFEIIKRSRAARNSIQGTRPMVKLTLTPVHGMKFFANHKRFGLKFANVGSVIESP